MKTKYYKDGNPEWYNYFSDAERKKMTEKEKAMWTPYSEVDEAPIPKEVLNFTESREKPEEVEPEKPKPPEKVEPLTEDERKKVLIEALKEKGIKANMNYKLETLENKLKDATDSE